MSLHSLYLQNLLIALLEQSLGDTYRIQEACITLLH